MLSPWMNVFLVFSEEVEHDILSSSFDRFHDDVASFACTESVSSSSSSLQSSFSQYFSPCAACYSYRDVHDFMAQTGKPIYLVARVPVPSTLNISTWRELLHDYEDSVVCDVLEFCWPVGFMPTTLPVFGSSDSSRCPSIFGKSYRLFDKGNFSRQGCRSF